MEFSIISRRFQKAKVLRDKVQTNSKTNKFYSSNCKMEKIQLESLVQALESVALALMVWEWAMAIPTTRRLKHDDVEYSW
jgi:nucleoside diphosphate kinase